MKTTNPLFLLAVILFGSLSLYAQTSPAAPPVVASYEVMLQVIVGSNSAEGVSLPQNLRAIAGQIRSNFTFTNYRLDNTYVGRIGSNGTFEYKSLSNSFGPGAEMPSFLEWSLGGLKSDTNEKGHAAFQAQPFRFGARVPIKVSTVTGDTGKTISSVNYESVGLTVNRVSLPENIPTLIGTLSLPKTEGTLFLVLTICPVD